MPTQRTDMALERREELDKELLASLTGLRYSSRIEDDMEICEIHVDDEQSSQTLGKPMGTYVTIDLQKKWQRDNDMVLSVANRLASSLRPLLPPDGGVLAVGLGNRSITSDSLGPKSLEKLVVTRHLREQLPRLFSSMREVSAVSPGVMGQTGYEALELVAGLCRRLKPSAVVAVDSLAAASLRRLGASFQIATSGIIPGEGAHSRRFALNMETLGVPVISVGVPTVAEAATLVRGLTGQQPKSMPEGFLAAPGDVDLLISKSAKAVGYGLNLALQGDMSVGDMEQLIS